MDTLNCQLLGEGNFVLVTSETAADARSIAFYDLFRVEDGKVLSTGTP